MVKEYLILIFIVVFTSCKEYTCECKIDGKVTSVKVITKVSKKKAQKECIAKNEFLCIGCESCNLK